MSRALLLLWAVLLGAPALAIEVEVVTPDGDAVPGRPTRLHVAAIDATGKPALAVQVKPGRGSIKPDPDEDDVAPGVSAWLWTPEAPGTAELTVSAGADALTVELPVRALPDLDLGVAGRLESPAQGPVLLRLTADDLPAPEDLVVNTSEPTEVERRDLDGAVELRLRPAGQGARVLLVALSDRRRATRPQLVRILLVDRPTLAFDVEPGARLRVKIGGRTYGPFRADAEGRVRASIEQRPGERSAEILVSDDLGNELATPYVLSALADPPLLIAPRGAPRPGALPPDLLVYATSIDGRPWTGQAPACRVPGRGEVLPMVRLVPGLWRVSSVGPARLAGDTLRLTCGLRDASVEARLRARAGVPHALDLRVGPDQISLDFPVAEVTAHLIDATGERLSADQVQVRADRGAVRLEPADGGSRRGEYRAGNQALVQGRDEVVASWTRPLGSGAPAGIEVGHGAVPVVGSLRVHARAVDPDGRPIPDVNIRVSAGRSAVEARSDERGWLTTDLQLPDGLGAVTVEARTGSLVARRVAPRGVPPQGGGPTTPDLTARVGVTLTSGRASTIEVSTDSPVLYLRPDASLPVRITVLDRGGKRIENEVPSLSVDHGVIGVPRPHPDGGYVATYTPLPDSSPRDVTITARAGSGTATGAVRVRLTAPPITTAVGVGLGVTTNLSRLTSPYLMVHFERRSFVDPLFLRVSASVYGGAVTVESNEAVQRNRITLFPVALTGLYRPQMGRWQLWAGGTIQLVPYHTTRVLDGMRRPALQGLLPPGVGVVLGAGRRIRLGELMIEVRPVFQTGSTGSGFSGQLGGFASYVGYRAVFD